VSTRSGLRREAGRPVRAPTGVCRRHSRDVGHSAAALTVGPQRAQPHFVLGRPKDVSTGSGLRREVGRPVRAPHRSLPSLISRAPLVERGQSVADSAAAPTVGALSADSPASCSAARRTVNWEPPRREAGRRVRAPPVCAAPRLARHSCDAEASRVFRTVNSLQCGTAVRTTRSHRGHVKIGLPEAPEANLSRVTRRWRNFREIGRSCRCGRRQCQQVNGWDASFRCVGRRLRQTLDSRPARHISAVEDLRLRGTNRGGAFSVQPLCGAVRSAVSIRTTRLVTRSVRARGLWR